MARSIDKFNQHNALALQSFFIVEMFSPVFGDRQAHITTILFFFFILEIYSFLEVVMEGEAIDEEVPDFKSVKLFLIFDELHRQSFSFFADQASRDTLIEYAYFREDQLHLSIHFFNEIILNEKPAKELLSFSFGELGLFIDNGLKLDDFHFIDDDFLAKIAFTAFIGDLVFDFILGVLGGTDVLDVSQHHVLIR